jgi:hypothetical protein
MATEPSSRKHSINEHFRREAKLPSIALAVFVAVALVMALLGPWLFERL